MALTRPLEVRVPGAVPLLIGAGPSGVQLTLFSGIEVDGVVRSSSRSSRSRDWRVRTRSRVSRCRRTWGAGALRLNRGPDQKRVIGGLLLGKEVSSRGTGRHGMRTGGPDGARSGRWAWRETRA